MKQVNIKDLWYKVFSPQEDSLLHTEADNADSLPAAGGAYALVIDLHRPLTLGQTWQLDEGRVLYAGSANGPGGIRARVRRHLKGAKTVRWHVDRLTNAFGVAMAVALPGMSECAIVDAARAWSGVTVPAPGFGSSDCRTCPAHLVSLPDGLDVVAGLAEIADAVVWRRPPVLCILPATVGQ